MICRQQDCTWHRTTWVTESGFFLNTECAASSVFWWVGLLHAISRIWHNDGLCHYLWHKETILFGKPHDSLRVQRRVLQTRFCHSSSPISWVYFVDVTLLVSRRLGVNFLRHNCILPHWFCRFFFAHFVSHLHILFSSPSPLVSLELFPFALFFTFPPPNYQFCLLRFMLFLQLFYTYFVLWFLTSALLVSLFLYSCHFCSLFQFPSSCISPNFDHTLFGLLFHTSLPTSYVLIRM